MDKFDKVLEIIEDYRCTADRIFSDYKKAEERARARLSPAAFQEEFKRGEWASFASNLWTETDKHVDKISDIFQQAREELEAWITAPIKPDVLETLNCVTKFGLKLSEKELKVIEKKTTDSYFGQKILAAVARDNGFQANVISADALIASLDVAESVAEQTVRAYAGRGGDNGFPGRDLLHHKELNGVDFGEFTVPEMATAAAPVRNGSIEYARDLFRKFRAPLQYKLTEEETKRIGDKIDGLVDRFGDIDRKKADQLMKEMPDVLSRLDSMPQDYGNVEILKKYYVLGNGDSQKEKKRREESSLKSMEFAKQYVAKNGPANADILNQY